MKKEENISHQKKTGESTKQKNNRKSLLLKGKKYGKWKVIDGIVERRGKLKYLWCICECGVKKQCSYQDLESGKNTKCITCSRRKDIIGTKIHNLTILSYCGKNEVTEGSSKILYKCLCDCGNIKKILATNFMHGKTKSCGCLAKQKSKDRITSKTKLYIKCENCKEKIETFSLQKRFCSKNCSNIITEKLRRRKKYILSILDQRIQYMKNLSSNQTEGLSL